eukprot:7732469-Alexandrium_andersonii.AAC.1
MEAVTAGEPPPTSGAGRPLSPTVIPLPSCLAPAHPPVLGPPADSAAVTAHAGDPEVVPEPSQGGTVADPY